MKRVDKNVEKLIEENERLRRRVEELDRVADLRESAESALRDSERKFRAFIDESAYGYFEFDLDGRVTFANKKAEEISGYSLAEDGNVGVMDLLHEDDIPRAIKDLEAAADLPNDGPREYRGRRKDGSIYYVEINTIPLIKDGKLVGYQCTALDITERMNALEALRESEGRYRLLAEHVSDVIWIMGMDLKLVYVSPSVERLRGYTPAEVMKQGLSEILTPESFEKVLKLLARERELLEKGLPDQYAARVIEWEEYTRDGGTVWVEARVAFVFDKDGRAEGVLGVSRDISDRKRAEQALSEMSQKFTGLYEAAYEGIIIHDAGRVIDLNDTMARMLGYDREEVIGTSLTKYAAPDSVPVILKNITINNPGPYEAVGVRKDGSKLVAELVGRPIWYQGRDVCITSVRDVTERRRAENALRESENLYRTLVETSPDAIVMTDLDTVIIAANRRSCELYGDDEKALIGKKAFSFIHPDDRKQAAWSVREILKKGLIKNVQYRVAKKDGSYVFCETSVSVIEDNRGKPKAYIGITRDITERKKAEEALRESESLYRTLVETNPDAIVLIDMEMRLVMASARAAELMGYGNPEEMLDISALELIAPVDRDKAARHLRSIMQGRELGAAEYTLIRADGSKILAEVRTSAIRDTTGNLSRFISVVRDVTEKRRTEEELRRVSNLESIGLLAGGIAHDFNNILTGIVSNVSLARLYAENNRKAVMKLNEAERAALRASNLTNQLLTFSKGGAPIKETACISELVRETVDFVLSGSNVTSRINIADDLWAVEFDVGQIGQVLNNMVLNAKQAMPEGGVIDITVENIMVDSDTGLPLNDGKYIAISLSDRGLGIEKKHLPRIFDPYFTTKQKGSGLGLTTSYSIIRKHEGHIAVESEMSKGTTFRIYLPAIEGNISIGAEETGEMVMGRGKILLMDDEEVIRIAAGGMLEHLGYEVVYASDGAEALEKFIEAGANGSGFDAMIIDLTVPGGMGGEEFIKQVRKIDQDVGAIVSSGYSQAPIMSNYTDYGFDGVLIKPYEMKELAKTVWEAVKKNAP